MKFKVKIEVDARQDIQDAVTWYNTQQKGLGKRYFEAVKKTISELKAHSKYQIKYDTFRCRQVRKFPFMFHYEILEDENLIIIYALIHTSQNPDEHWLKK